MALSPGVPTSFMPKQPVQTVRRPMRSGSNLFLVITLIIAALTVVAAAGTYFYNELELKSLASKQEQLKQDEDNVDDNTIQEFIRLRDRLTNGTTLLSRHVVMSQFFNAIEQITLQNVRFDTLKISVAGDQTAKLEMAGSAKNFNALAAQSNAFASQSGIKRAIFSNITLAKDNAVTFKIDADVDSSLLIEGTNPLPNASAAPATSVNTAAPQATSSTSPTS